VLVDNEPGVLARVIGLFSGRGYNIDSLTVSETEHEAHLSRITIVTTATPMMHRTDQAAARAHCARASGGGPDRAIGRTRLNEKPLERELALIKVTGAGDERVEALRLADAFRATGDRCQHRAFRF
jgi:acetolactate synthase-1/3 small subunit